MVLGVRGAAQVLLEWRGRRLSPSPRWIRRAVSLVRCLPFRAEPSLPSDAVTVTRLLPWRSSPGPCACVPVPRGPAPRFSLKVLPPVQRAAVGFQDSGYLVFRALGICL